MSLGKGRLMSLVREKWSIGVLLLTARCPLFQIACIDENKNQLHWPGIEPGADRSRRCGNDPGYHYPTSALKITISMAAYSKLHAPLGNKNKLHWPGIEPGADRSGNCGNDPGYHYPTSALKLLPNFPSYSRATHFGRRCPNAKYEKMAHALMRLYQRI